MHGHTHTHTHTHITLCHLEAITYKVITLVNY